MNRQKLGQSGAGGGGDAGTGAVDHRHLHQTYFGRAIRAFHAGPGHGGAGDAALRQPRAPAPRAAYAAGGGAAASSVTAVVSVLAIGKAFGLSGVMLASLAPKSTTAPRRHRHRRELGESHHHSPGAVAADRHLRRHHRHAAAECAWHPRLADAAWSLGVAAHGISTARAFRVNGRQRLLPAIGMG